MTHPSYEAVRKVLRENGPMTAVEVWQMLRSERKADVSSILSRMRSLVVKQVYIRNYVYHVDGAGRRYPRAVYALGNRRCAKKPKPVGETERSRQRRMRERERRQHVRDVVSRVPNSVFNLQMVTCHEQ